MLHELGDGGMLTISVQCGPNGTDGMFADGPTQYFHCTSFNINQIGLAFTRGEKLSPSSSNIFLFDARVAVLG